MIVTNEKALRRLEGKKLIKSITPTTFLEKHRENTYQKICRLQEIYDIYDMFIDVTFC